MTFNGESGDKEHRPFGFCMILTPNEAKNSSIIKKRSELSHLTHTLILKLDLFITTYLNENNFPLTDERRLSG